MIRRRWGKETKDRAAELRATGMGYKAIADQLGVNHTSVSRWLNPAAAERHRKRNLERWHETYSPKARKQRNDAGNVEYAAVADYDTARPLCRCGLSLPCNDCLPTRAADFAAQRMVTQSMLVDG